MNSHVVINLETINDPDEDLVTETNPDVLFVIYTLFDSSKTSQCFSNQQQTPNERVWTLQQTTVCLLFDRPSTTAVNQRGGRLE